jgi:hypothetical protein
MGVKRLTSFWQGAYKVRNHMGTITADNVAKDTHTASLLKPVFGAKAKVFVNLAANFICVEMNALQLAGKRFGQSCFARAR